MALAGGESMKSHPQKVAARLPDIFQEDDLCLSWPRSNLGISVNQLYLCSVSSVSWKIKNKHQDLGNLFSQRSSKYSFKSPELIVVSVSSLLLQSFAEQWSHSVFLPSGCYSLLINQLGFLSVVFKIWCGLY